MTTTTTKERNRRKAAATSKRRQDAGLRQATFWLTPEVQTRLAKLALQHSVSREAIVQRALLAYPMPSLRVGQRVIWLSPLKIGLTRHGVVRRWADAGNPALGFTETMVDVKFDDASDDGIDWRPARECEPE